MPDRYRHIPRRFGLSAPEQKLTSGAASAVGTTLVYCFLNNWTNYVRNNKRALSRISRLRALEISALTHSVVMLWTDRISSSLS